MHAFMGAFELGSRLPPPPGAATTSAGQLRFSLEQMLEVLEAALLQPRHGLASEGQLLRWQLRRMLDFGQPRDAQAAPPLACPPPSPSAPLDEPRVRVVVPFVASERARLTSLLRRWAGSSAPCTLPRRVGAPGVAPGAVDLTFLFADPPGAGQEWLHPPEALVGEAARCFGRVELRHANLSRAAQHYVGGWDNTGPNSLFFGLWNDDAVQSAGHDFLFWMETDVVPVAGRWVERILEEARSPRGFWRKARPAAGAHPLHGARGAWNQATAPRCFRAKRGARPQVSEHHYHMNSVGLYRLGEPCFRALLRRVEREHPRQPHDVSTHIWLHDPRRFHIWQRHAHRFLYTDLVQNSLADWTLEDVRDVSPDTAFVHGKHAPAHVE